MHIRMSEAEEEQARAIASSAENAVNNESKKFNKQHHVRNGGRCKGNRKGFGRGRNGPKKECEGATKALDGHVFVDPVEDSIIRQDNYRRTIEAIETWHHTNQSSPPRCSFHAQGCSSHPNCKETSEAKERRGRREANGAKVRRK